MDASHRIAELRRFMAERDLALCLIKNPDNQYYLSGFKAVIYSRPIDLVITPQEIALIVPGLEEAHARAEAAVDQLFVYYEHPEMAPAGTSHLHHLDGILAGLRDGGLPVSPRTRNHTQAAPRSSGTDRARPLLRT